MRELLMWFEPRRGAYPWRRRRDAYAVLVSEVMLQQTQASRVAPAFDRFMEAFPSLQVLASAPAAEVIRVWSGLGYNRRAVELSNAARAIVRDHGGVIPDEPEALARLPGVGPYTAAAVASIAYGRPVAAIDTNVRRVVARSLLGKQPEEVRPAEIRDAADRVIVRRDPGGWNQAVMDLGREVCRPAPRCSACPIAPTCRLVTKGEGGPAHMRRGPAFEGSTRQLRGQVIRELGGGPMSLARLGRRIGHPVPQLIAVIEGLALDGLVAVSPAVAAGRPAGRIRLAEDRTGGRAGSDR